MVRMIVLRVLVRAVLGALLLMGGSGCAGGGPRPLVLAHRGASGYLPEHTLAAYALAHGQGADFIEPDLVLTRDGVLVCAHDTTAEGTTNIAEVFPGRARPDGKWYFADFTLAEVRMLDAWGRDRAGPGHRVPTFEEMVTLVRTLNERTGRRVGIIPEPKRPAWHAEQGLDMEAAVRESLTRLAYWEAARESPERAIVQCFDLAFLRGLRRDGWSGELVWLIGDPVDDAGLDGAAGIVDGLGPARALLEDEQTGTATDLWARATARRLALYPYTFKDEAEATRRFMRRGAAGVFTDYPDVAVRARGR